jgi:hypothetical protein
MRLVPSLLVCSAAWLQVHAFSPLATSTSSPRKTLLALHATTTPKAKSTGSPCYPPLASQLVQAQKALAAVFVAGALWAAPAATTQLHLSVGLDTSNPIGMVANAKEMASGSGSRVNKDPESLLRYGLPITNKEVSTASMILVCIILVLFY